MEKDILKGERAIDTAKSGGLTGNGCYRPVFAEFQANVLQPNNFSGATGLPLSHTPLVLAALTGAQALGLDAGDRVWLTGTVGWQAEGETRDDQKDKKKDEKKNEKKNEKNDDKRRRRVDVVFRIFRNAPVTGPQIFSTRDSVEARKANFRTTSFVHVDINPVIDGATLVSYFLTAEVAGDNDFKEATVAVIGPITFTAAEIEPNYRRPV